MSGNAATPERKPLAQRLQTVRAELREQRRLMAAIKAMESYRAEAIASRRELSVFTPAPGSVPDRYEQLYNFVPIGYATLDRDGIITDINQAASSLLKIGRAQAVGMPLLPFVIEADRAALVEHMSQSRTGKLAVSELRMQPREGEVIQVQLRTKAWSGSIGAAEVLYPTAIVDLTEIRRAERERQTLVRRTDEAQAANKSKDRFLAMLSHELRTPLTPALAAVSSPELRESVPPAMRDLLDIARRSIEMEVRLIDDLLDVSRLTQGKVTLHKSAADLHPLIEEVAQMCQAEAQAGQLNVSVELQAHSHHGLIDSERMRQVFLNLLRNAIKFTPPGGRVSIRTANLLPDCITFSVRDTGIGIDPARIAETFEPFVQVGPQRGIRDGLGLGLAICKGLVEAHGGSIRGHSEGAGTGATFEVTMATIPAATVASSGDNGGGGGGIAAPARAESATPPRSLRIMLVEDHRDTAMLMSKILTRTGHTVEVADSIGAAIQLAHKIFDVVVSDLNLPDGDGCNLMRQLAPLGLRGIALSGLASDEDIRRCKTAGFQAHLPKPVDIQKLLTTLAKVTSGDAPEIA